MRFGPLLLVGIINIVAVTFSFIIDKFCHCREIMSLSHQKFYANAIVANVMFDVNVID